MLLETVGPDCTHSAWSGVSQLIYAANVSYLCRLVALSIGLTTSRKLLDAMVAVTRTPPVPRSEAQTLSL